MDIHHRIFQIGGCRTPSGRRGEGVADDSEDESENQVEYGEEREGLVYETIEPNLESMVPPSEHMDNRTPV
jgi:hypothetical protein